MWPLPGCCVSPGRTSAVRHGSSPSVVPEPHQPTRSRAFLRTGFQGRKKSEAALKRWDDWVKLHPLPTPPEPRSRPGAALRHAGRGIGGRVGVALHLGAALVKLAWSGREKPPADPAALFGLPVADGSQHKGSSRRKLIATKSYASAVSLLGEILADRRDYSHRPESGVPTWRRLKADAEFLLAELPAEAIDEYERQFGRTARQALSEAVTSGQPSSLAEVVPRFFFTEAGAEAAYLLGTHYRTLNDFARASSCFGRLARDPRRGSRFEPAPSIELAACYLKAGMPQAAKNVLREWKSRQREPWIVLGGRKREVFSDDERSLSWLAALTGLPPPAPTDGLADDDSHGRDEAARGGNPWLKAKYQVPSSSDPFLRTCLAKVCQQEVGQRVPFADEAPMVGRVAAIGEPRRGGPSLGAPSPLVIGQWS